ncbi:MAG: coenzyme F420-0:L-glutamate ligase [Hadesarchaea archaeon]|nr:coenzyme F420-0:L-glutamate ligase [Hadesarchaea archaeon]
MELRLIGIRTPLIRPGDHLPSLLLKALRRAGGVREGDILVLSSKVVAVSQGRMVRLSEVRPSPRALRLSRKTGLDPSFVEVVLREADSVLGASRGALLTLVKGLPCANAGVDLSNAPPGHAILLPSHPERFAKELREYVRREEGVRVGVILADSTVKPLRLGTVGQAVGISGVPGALDCRGRTDLFGRRLRVTRRALADQLATAAELLMGEAGERIPLVVVRGLRLEGKAVPSPAVEPEECLYFSLLKGGLRKDRRRL